MIHLEKYICTEKNKCSWELGKKFGKMTVNINLDREGEGDRL